MTDPYYEYKAFNIDTESFSSSRPPQHNMRNISHAQAADGNSDSAPDGGHVEYIAPAMRRSSRRHTYSPRVNGLRREEMEDNYALDHISPSVETGLSWNTCNTVPSATVVQDFHQPPPSETPVGLTNNNLYFHTYVTPPLTHPGDISGWAAGAMPRHEYAHRHSVSPKSSCQAVGRGSRGSHSSKKSSREAAPRRHQETRSPRYDGTMKSGALFDGVDCDPRLYPAEMELDED